MLKGLVGKLQAWHRERRIEKENYVIAKAMLLGMEIRAIDAHNENEAYLACNIGTDPEINELVYHTDRYTIAKMYLSRREIKASWRHLFLE